MSKPNKPQSCWPCHGTGQVWNPPVGAITCGACNGTGRA